jgi:protein involved in polysaccharide export with SLBB domain
MFKNTFYILILLLATSFFAQNLNDIKNIIQRQSPDLSARSKNMNLEELAKQQKLTDSKKLQDFSDYIPVEGMIDDSLYIIGPHDILSVTLVTVDDQEALTFELIVNPDGEVIIPNTGALVVSGRSLRQARDLIKEKIRSAYKVIRLSVNLVSIRVFRSHITGLVVFPGAYNVTSCQRLTDLIEQAGGYTSGACLASVRIFRGSDTLTFNLNRYYLDGDLSQNPFLSDGDVVNITGASIGSDRVYLSGAVKRQGYYSISDYGDLMSLVISSVDRCSIMT